MGPLGVCICFRPGLGIVADLYRCDTPGGGAIPILHFTYNNFPKKAISLRKCTIFFFQKKSKNFSRLRRAIPLRPPGGCAIEFPVFQHSSILPLYLSLGARRRLQKSPKNRKNGQKRPHRAPRNCTKKSKNALKRVKKGQKGVKKDSKNGSESGLAIV